MPSPISKGNPISGSTSIKQTILRGLTQSKTETRSGGRLYPSGGALCSRKDVLHNMRLDLFGEPQYIWSATSEFYVTVGEAMHDTVRKGIDNQDKLFGNEVRCPEININLGGYIDGVVEDEDQIKLLEIKSCGALPTRPRESHYNQALIYSISAGLPAILVYVSRKVAGFNKELMITSFEVVPTYDEYRMVLERLCLSYIAFKKGKLPRIPDNLTSDKKCEQIYCPFIKNCWYGVHASKLDDIEISIMEEPKFRQKATEIAERIITGWESRRGSFLTDLRINLEPRLENRFIELAKDMRELL